MSTQSKKLVFWYNKDYNTMVWQRAEYIEDGPYIELTSGKYIVREIAQYGGRECEEGDFDTLKEALDKYYWLIENHT